MTKVVIPRFGGMVPRTSPRLIDDTQAAFASNCKLTNGSLVGFGAPGLVGVVALPPGMTLARRAFPIYRPDGSIFWFPRSSLDASLVKSTVTGDSFNRFYWTEPGQAPKYAPLDQMEAGHFFTLGLPVPGVTPNVSPAGGAEAPEAKTIRAYVYVYVSPYGEESAPSPAQVREGYTDQTWTISGWVDPGDVDRPTTRVHLYRTVVGTSASAFFFVADLPIDASSYDDDVPDAQVVQSNLLESVGWRGPPSDLQGLVASSAGFMAGFVGRDVHFSVAYRPHAWPADQVLRLQHEVVALAPLGDSILALTTGYPVLLTGSTPASITPVSINDVQPCLSSRSVVGAGNSILYASPNGLVEVTSNGLDLATRELLTRTEWTADYAPEDIIAALYGPYYVAVTGASRGFAWCGRYEPATLTRLDRLRNVDGVEQDPRTGACYLLVGNAVHEFDALDDQRQSTTWTSKEFVLQRPENMGAYRVMFDAGAADPLADTGAIDAATQAWNDDRMGFPMDPIGGTGLEGSVLGGVDSPYPVRTADGNGYSLLPPLRPIGGSPLFTVQALFGTDVVRVKIAADGKVRYLGAVSSEAAKKLPSGFKARRWQVTLEANRRVHEFAMAGTAKELGGDG